MAMAAQLCTCVFDGNLPLLRRLITAGAPADAGDYDKRTALHIAAAEGNTAAVSALQTMPSAIQDGMCPPIHCSSSLFSAW